MCCTACPKYMTCSRNTDVLDDSANPRKGCCSDCLGFDPNTSPDENGKYPDGNLYWSQGTINRNCPYQKY